MADFREQITIDATSKGFQNVEKQLNKLQKSVRGVGDEFTRIGKALSLRVTAPLTALGALAIKTSSDFEEASSKFNTVFRDIDKQAQQVARTFARDFGRSLLNANELLGNTGDLLTGFGFAQEQALDLSESVNQLAVDLASFTNFSGGAEGASNALTKALLGETESLKSLGIAIRQDDVQAKIESLKATGDLTNETENQQKAIATLALAYEQSGNAIGDFERTQDSTANIIRQLNSEVENLLVLIGDQLRPTFTDLSSRLLEVVRFLTSLEQATIKTAVQITAFVATIPPLLVGFGLFIKLLAFAVTPFTLIFGIATSLVTALDVLGERFSFVGRVLSAINTVTASVASAFAFLAESIITVIRGFLELGALADTILGTNSFLTRARDQVLDLEDSIKGLRKDLSGFAGAEFDNIFEGEQRDVLSPLDLLDLSTEAINRLKDEAKKLGDEFAKDFSSSAKSTGQEEGSKPFGFIDDQVTDLGFTGQTLANNFTDAFIQIGEGAKGVGEAFSNLAQNIIKSLTQRALTNALGNLLLGAGGQAGGTPIAQNAEGGLFNGKGTGTSDSNLSWISDGEYIVNARSTKAFLPLLQQINSLKNGFSFPKSKLGMGAFANGGQVGGSSAVNVNVINNSSRQLNAEAESRVDGRQIVIDVVVDDLNSNGLISSTLQNTYGVNR